MKPAAIIGIILILLGIAALAYQGITYRQRETVLNLGPLHAEADHEKTIPIIGVAAVVGGIALLVVGMRKSS